MHIFLSLRKMILGRGFFSVIAEILILEHHDDGLKEQKCQVLFLVALGKIMDFSTTIICNLLLHKCKTGFGKPTLFSIWWKLQVSIFCKSSSYISLAFSFFYLILCGKANFENFEKCANFRNTI